MRARSYLSLSVAAVAVVIVQACSQTPVIVPLRSMERPKDVDFICLQRLDATTWTGADLSDCSVGGDGVATHVPGVEYRLHAVVTQQARGELAVADLGRTPGDPAGLAKVDPRIPGYSFLPVTAVPSDVVADPAGHAVYVASGRDPRIEIIPAGMLRGPIDSRAAAGNEAPWPRIDLDRVNDGTPGAMAIQREGDLRRLYVTLPDASGGPRLAVFDLSKPLVPARMADITLTLSGDASIQCLEPTCGPGGDKRPWWVARCNPAAPQPPAPTAPCVTVPAPTKTHLAGIALVGGLLYAADDVAPIVHVFDIYRGRGAEIARLPIGSETVRVSVSPVVPDEVTLDNSAAIEVCRANGWLGDGLDHSADSPTVSRLLGGKCSAHRYLYAVDLTNPQAGDGSLAILDLPVTFGRTNGVVDRKLETVDFANAKMVQALACDAPQFPKTRLPVGPFGVGVANAVPARAVAFLDVDPDITGLGSQPAARCRPFAPNDHPRKDPDLSPADKVSPEVARARIAIGEAWRVGVEPRRLRGVFAYVAMTNGAIVVVDIDDYDALCRGPKIALDPVSKQEVVAAAPAFKHPSEKTTLGSGKEGILPSDEYFPRVVRRHHLRSLRAYTPDYVPTAGGVSLSQYDVPLSNTTENETGRGRPRFATLAPPVDGRPILAISTPDNPYAITSENWIVTYEGPLPTFANELGRFAVENGKVVVRGGIAYCAKGVETEGPTQTHDSVQVVDPICPYDTCSVAEREACVANYGEAAERPIRRSRFFTIEKAFDDRLELAVPSLPADFATCFGRKGDPLPLLKFLVRSTGSWVVVGTATGYLHRQIADAAGACVTDPAKPAIQTGRTREKATEPVPECELFANPSWQFAIVSGKDASTPPKPVPSATDMRFVFGGRFAFQPMSLAAGVLLQTVKPIAATWDGEEQLRWRMIATVDAVERGLFVFPGGAPYSFQKAVN